MASVMVHPLPDDPTKGIVCFGDQQWPCALGKGGVTHDKVEGDGASPVGCYAVRWLYYRPDRSPEIPQTGLPCRPIHQDDGWCDGPDHPDYNRPITLPHPASHEVLWRDDRLYDLIVVLGHNDSPPVPGRGSAIFMHVARDGYKPTEGCVALAKPDLLALVALLSPDDQLCIGAGPTGD